MSRSRRSRTRRRIKRYLDRKGQTFDPGLAATLLEFLLDGVPRSEDDLIMEMVRRGYNRPWAVIQHMEAMRDAGLLEKTNEDVPEDLALEDLPAQRFMLNGKRLPEGHVFTRKWWDQMERSEKHGFVERIFLEDGTVDFRLTDSGSELVMDLESEDD